MTQLAISAVNNRNLFSNHYLESLIQKNREWSEDVTEAFALAKKIYESRRGGWERMDEAMLEEFLIRPILGKVLGHYFVPQAAAEGGKRPDYAFFENENDLNEALEHKGLDDIYLKAIAAGDAKSWKTSLDKKAKGIKGSFELQNPSFQIDHYLHVTPVQWGILTNGRQWRIYHKETSYKLDSYYEIDLATVLEKNDAESFKYFYLFFRLSAFIKDASGRSFLERVKDESIAYAKKLGEDLQKNVYEAMGILSEGFFDWKDNALAKNEQNLKEVQENTLKLLYRLLFIFYAESLKLLERDNPEYKKLSLESLKNDVAKKIDNRELVLPATTEYWNKLNTLFDLINEGSESERFGIPKEILYIPAYNGGLFDPERNLFLKNKRIGDKFVAEAIDLLAREGKDFIDYSTLGTRQLGSIYEGLLEYKLKVAEEDLVAVKQKGHEKWITKKETEGKKSFDEIKTGALYLVTDKGERKATGSYYTPDYIVKYIVRNTLEPILDEKRKAWKEKGLGERPFLHDILGIRVLDPAMGSGHFLVEACEFLANRLVEAWGEAKPEELESEEVAEHDVHWARREVVRHCIFGVDLNPMAVELAKLSLWLETVAANKPLTFLDHHLKVGNSLIGAQVRELKTLPSKDKKEGADNGKKQLKAPTLWDFTVKKHFEELLVKYGEFAAHPDDDLGAVKQKEQEYDALQKSELNRRLHELANVWVATYFGAATPPDEYAEMQNEMNPKDFSDWSKWRGRAWFAEAQRLAGEKRFFHWELEFPESFYEKGAPKENPGWDAVVGNPPYFSMERVTHLQPIFEKMHNEIYAGKLDISTYFLKIGIDLIKNNGRVSYITARYFLEAIHGLKLRRFCSQKSIIREIVDFGNFQVFDADVLTIIISLEKNPSIPLDESVKILKYDETTKNITLLPPYTGFTKFGIRLSNFNEMPWLLNEAKGEKLITNIKSVSYPLIEMCRIGKGMESGLNEAFVVTKEIIERWKLEPYRITNHVQGKDLTRYSITHRDLYIIYNENISDIEKFPAVKSYLMQFKEKLEQRKNFILGNCKWYTYGSPLNTDIYERAPEKLICPYMATHARFGYDACTNEEKYFTFTDTTIIVRKDETNYSLKFILSLLNSSLLNYIHHQTSKLKRDGYYEYFSKTLENIPIRRISFTTPPARRAALFGEAKALCSAEAPDSGCPAFKCGVMDFVGARLDAKPEESDVVHDLLAHLAERMIEMNKEKNAEIKGFLRWLEGEIGAPVEEMANKTALKEYYAHDFEAFAGALVKNKKKLKDGYDPTRREPKDRLQQEYGASMAKLAPLMRRIEATDGLIDAIVYRLYGLTEDEIRIVEGSISGDKDKEVSKQ